METESTLVLPEAEVEGTARVSNNLDSVSPVRGKWTLWSYCILITRLAFAALFIYAGAQKVQDPAGFMDDLQKFHLLPESLALPFAFYLPWLEIAVGLGLLVPIVYPGAVLLCGGMLAGFFVALCSAAWRGLDISCGCFGHASGGESVKSAIIRDVVLILVWTLLVRDVMKRSTVRPNQ